MLHGAHLMNHYLTKRKKQECRSHMIVDFTTAM